MKNVLMIIKLSISLIKIMAIYQSPNYYVLWTYLVNEGVYLWRFLNQNNYQKKKTKSILNVNAKRTIVHSHQLSLAVTVISIFLIRYKG